MTSQERAEIGHDLMMTMAKALESADGVDNGIVTDAIFNVLLRAISHAATDDEARQEFERYGHTLLTLSAKHGDIN
jgi:hypothetical protein